MISRRLALNLALAAGLIHGQNDNKPEIRGTVIEPGLNLGVGGAEITLFEFLLDSERTVVRTPVATTFTDARGAFRFQLQHFGDYYVEAKKNTYVALLTGSTESAGTPASVKPDHPSEEVRFSLMRPGELTGRVVDDDGKPVQGLGIRTEQRELGISFGAGRQPVTDKDGTFTVKLAPGQYLLRVLPKGGEFETVIRPFSEDDLKIVDQDVESAYQPGGVTDPAAALPLLVSPGASTDLGIVTVHQKPYYRAHVTVAGAECASKESWMFSAIPKGRFFSLGYVGVPCAKEFLIRGLRPGSYWFTLRNGTTGWALAEVEVTRENVEVSMALSPMAEISGRIIPGEGVPLPKFEKVALMLRARMGGMFVGSDPGAVDAAGKFTVKNLPGMPHDISVRGLGGRYYVKEIRYNGVVSADGMFTPVQDAPAQNLEIVLDDQPGTITGTVTNGDKSVSKPLLLVVKLPFTEGDPLMNADHPPAGDEQGRFSIPGLAPGEYRILALTKNVVNLQISTQLLSRGEKVTVERGGLQDVALKLIDPSK